MYIYIYIICVYMYICPISNNEMLQLLLIPQKCAAKALRHRDTRFPKDWLEWGHATTCHLIGFHEHTWIEHCFAPFFWLTNKVTRYFGQQNGQFQFQVANWRQVNSTKMSDLSSWLRQKHPANDPFWSTNVPLSLFLTPSPDVPWSIAMVYYIPDPCGIGITNPFSIGIFWRHSVGIPTMGWMTTKKKNK